MKPFLDSDFLLTTPTSQELYHDYAAAMPIIDYHCHLPPQQIAEDARFQNLTQAWLYGDHYKWRAMRANGVNERYITGDASDREKFEHWAATVPCTLRNPLYHWTHLELQRYFGIYELLNEKTAGKIYDECTEKLQTPEYSVRNLLRKMNVEAVCTTDDPADTLQHHKQLKNDGFEIPVLPAFRPDKAMEVSNAALFNTYVAALEAASQTAIGSYEDFLSALRSRHDCFAASGCSVSDHGVDKMYADGFTYASIASLFDTLRRGNDISPEQQREFKSALLLQFATWDWERGWVQQYHIGAMRNNNSRMMQKLGADTGWDSVGDYRQGRALSAFLNRLDADNKLTKTILYNLNPADNELMATMIGNFNDGTIPGKIQWGSAWWFLDQKEGMTKQLNTLSNMGLLSRFVGMITDSRSFLSFPRHEYFRRILCNLFGEETERGELPNDLAWTGKIIQDICYYNAKQYFGFPAPGIR